MHITTKDITFSKAVSLNNSPGNYKTRLCLNGASDDKTKIYVLTTFFTSFIAFFDRILHEIGFERKWVWLSLTDHEGGKKNLLVNINSLVKRTQLTRNEVLQAQGKLNELIQQNGKVISSYKELHDLFPHSYLLNLKSREDRLENFITHLHAIGESSLNFHREEAIDGKTLPIEQIKKMSKSDRAKKTGEDDRAGRLGCFLSHLKMLHKAQDEGHEFVLFMEDDIRFIINKLPHDYIEKAMKELPKDWGILYLGHYDANEKAKKEYSPRLVMPGCPYDNHAYVVSKSMLPSLIGTLNNELKKDDGQMRALDVVIAHEFADKGKLFALKKNIAIQKDGKSDIVNMSVDGNYKHNLTAVIDTPVVQSTKTADGMPVMKPLLAGTLYQLMKGLDQVFTKHGIRYWVDGGTLLGLERHKGLIPWDDDLDIQIFPGDEMKINAEVKQDLANLGMEIADHWLGFKVYAEKDHPDGKTHDKDGCHFKAPAIDLFLTQAETRDGKTVYTYSKEEARRIWPPEDCYFSHEEIFGDEKENASFKRCPFGPIEVNGLFNGKEICKRTYGPNCLKEATLQYDHINERRIEKHLIHLTDYRPPAFQPWEGLKVDL